LSRVDTDAMRRYEQTRDDLVARLLAVEALLRAAQDEKADGIREIREKLVVGKFVLAVVGEFSSGKSFLLNALLGKFGLLATDINPSTATITELEFGERDEATAIYEDGRRERVALDSLSRFVAVGSSENGGLHDATKNQSGAPERVVVQTNSAFLKRGFALADTPGLASINPAHRRATLAFLPSADAVLYLIDTQQPFTEGDAAFLGIVRSHVDSIFIVQTKIDLWRSPLADGRSEWEHAHERICALAAVHAPGTYVYALSAREYVDGTLANDAALVATSRFREFTSALDASLIRRTGRSRLRRAHDRATAIAADAMAQIGRDLEMLALDAPALRTRSSAVEPVLAQTEERGRAEQHMLDTASAQMRERMRARGAHLADDVERALDRVFDTADVARLRDRARLHSLVDRVIARAVGDFAQSTARAATADFDAAVERARGIVPLRWAPSDAAARAFRGEPAAALWNGELDAAIAATIVLEAVGGPSIALVHDVATRFATRPPGGYMKRELAADLRSEIFPRMRVEMQAFAERIGGQLSCIYDDLSRALLQAVAAQRDADAGSIERALEAHRADRTAIVAQELSRQRDALAMELERMHPIVERFMEHDAEIAPADPGSHAVRIAHAADAPFDAKAYDRGLRPSRWRVAVLGALRRGKSSLINAFAQANVLTDDIAGSMHFPVHVRYGEREQAFVLGTDGEWSEVPFAEAAGNAARAPVLLLVPWNLPRELVLVHAPAFDSGDPEAEDVNVVAASHASEVLCLFSRQLSDRELALYERIAELGKPMLFAHTIADNEAPGERRGVAMLAQQYLREHHIPAERVFVVSAREYAQAKREGRASAGWNETEALRATLEAHAEEHMARLERAVRQARTDTPATAAQAPQAQGFFSRLLRKGR
jgi:predicted GTPase